METFFCCLTARQAAKMIITIQTILLTIGFCGCFTLAMMAWSGAIDWTNSEHGRALFIAIFFGLYLNPHIGAIIGICSEESNKLVYWMAMTFTIISVLVLEIIWTFYSVVFLGGFDELNTKITGVLLIKISVARYLWYVYQIMDLVYSEIRDIEKAAENANNGHASNKGGQNLHSYQILNEKN